jgi:hypothetical protein
VGVAKDILERGGKIADRMGNAYGYIDTFSKVFSLIVKVEEQGWTMEEAVLTVDDYYANYNRLGDVTNWLRRNFGGASFAAFTDQTAKRAVRGVRNRAGTMAAMIAFPGLLTLATKLLLGVDDEEAELLQSGTLYDKINKYWQPLIPFRDSKGKLLRWDLRWIIPLVSDFRIQTGPGGIGFPLLFTEPVSNSLIELMMNREGYTGRDIFTRDASTAVHAAELTAYLARSLVPLPAIVTKGAVRIVEAARGGDEGYFLRTVAKEIFGVNIRAASVDRQTVYKILRQRHSRADQDGMRAIVKWWDNVYRIPERPGKEARSPVSDAGLTRSIVAARKREAIPPDEDARETGFFRRIGERAVD